MIVDRLTKGSLKPFITLLAIVLLWGVLAQTTYSAWVNYQGKRFDFFPRWYGAQEMLQGRDPYSEEVNRAILEVMGYDEYIRYKHNFMYPATVTLILLPFFLLPSHIALSLWCSLQLLCLVIMPALLWTDIFQWKVSSTLLVGTIFASIFLFRQAMLSYLLGQFVAFILFWLLLAAWAVHKNLPWLAAVALIFSTIRPDGIVLTAAMLAYLLYRRHFRIVIIWAGIMGGLFLITVLQIGFWVPRFLEVARGYRECCNYSKPMEVIHSDLVVSIMIAGISLWGLWMLWRIRKLPEPLAMVWFLSISIIVSLLIVPQSKDYTLVYTLLPVWFIMWLNRENRRMLGFIFLYLISPWIYMLTMTNMALGGAYPLEQTLSPLLLAAALTYTERVIKKPSILEMHGKAPEQYPDITKAEL